MGDLISREAAETLFRNARKALMEQSRKEHIKDFNTRDLMLLNAEQLIHLLPSVEPERKKGKWIEKAEDYYKAINEYGGGVDEITDYFTDDIACPKCLSKFSTIDNETERFDFCPACGADMREVSDGND